MSSITRMLHVGLQNQGLVCIEAKFQFSEKLQNQCNIYNAVSCMATKMWNYILFITELKEKSPTVHFGIYRPNMELSS